jgi:hypothetical protein
MTQQRQQQRQAVAMTQQRLLEKSISPVGL